MRRKKRCAQRALLLSPSFFLFAHPSINETRLRSVLSSRVKHDVSADNSWCIASFITAQDNQFHPIVPPRVSALINRRKNPYLCRVGTKWVHQTNTNDYIQPMQMNKHKFSLSTNQLASSSSSPSRRKHSQPGVRNNQTTQLKER